MIAGRILRAKIVRLNASNANRILQEAQEKELEIMTYFQAVGEEVSPCSSSAEILLIQFINRKQLEVDEHFAWRYKQNYTGGLQEWVRLM